MLFVERIIVYVTPHTHTSAQVTAQFKESEKESTRVLSELHIWTQEATNGGMPGWKMDDNFKENLRSALMGG